MTSSGSYIAREGNKKAMVISAKNKKMKVSCIIKCLCYICVAQILFTLFIALRVLNATLKPDSYLFQGPGPIDLSDKELKMKISLSELEKMVPAEFTIDPSSEFKPFVMKPISILSKKKAMEEDLNKLIVSGNLKEEASVKTENSVQNDINNEYPYLKMLTIRPVESQSNNLPSNVNPNVGIPSAVSIEGQKSRSLISHIQTTNSSIPVVHIYGKASIGRYLWSHIIGGNLSADITFPGTLLGQKSFDNIHLIYREGPALVPGPSTPADAITRLVLVLNGRTNEKVAFARKWLNHLNANRTTHKMKIIVVMLGNENCSNAWIKDYVSSGLIKAVLFTYDDSMIDNKVYYQWPLGVATYREFPSLSSKQIDRRMRQYSCTVSATMHQDSPSRQTLAMILKNYEQRHICSVFFRDKWQPNEDRTSMTKYVESLLSADLVLCPAGYNAETYRAYEAMEAGAVPVIEDKQPQSAKGCDSNAHRLLKEYDAPVIWIKSWYDLQQLLEAEKKMNERGKKERRHRVRRWYGWFKGSMAQILMNLVREKLLR